MSNKSKLIIVVILLVVVGSSIFYLVKNKPQIPPTQSKINVEKQLFPDPIEDTFPEDTLQIPQDQWKTDNQALALRALKYFEAKGVITKSIPQDQVEYRKGIIKSWGKPWRLHFLKNNLNQAELQMVWDEELVILADTPEELAKLELDNQEKLARVKPSVEVDKDKFTGYYETSEQIAKDTEAGILSTVSLKNVKTGENLYSATKLVAAVNEVDLALENSKNIYEVSSTTRTIKLQELLRKLGYPAAKASFHNLGKAIDFKLKPTFNKKFNEYLSSKLPNGSTRLEQIDTMIKSGTYPTMDILIAKNILPSDYELVKAYKTLKTTTEKVGIQVYDEMPFFTTFDEKTNKLEWISPVLHLQLQD